MFQAGTVVQFEDDVAEVDKQMFFLKFLGKRRPGNPTPGKVSFVARVWYQNNGSGPLTVGLVWNDGTDACYGPLASIPDNLKLIRKFDGPVLEPDWGFDF